MGLSNCEVLDLIDGETEMVFSSVSGIMSQSLLVSYEHKFLQLKRHPQSRAGTTIPYALIS